MSNNHLLTVAVLDDYDQSISKLKCWELLKPHFHVHFFSKAQTPKSLASYDALVTVRERTIVSREFLASMPNLKHLAVTGRLSGQADLDELRKRGVAASFTDGSGQSASELTIALMLAALKGVHTRHVLLREGGWQSGLGTSLNGKTLGVLGLGRVGQKVALFGKLMGMNVISWGPTPDQGRSDRLEIKRLGMSEVLAQSDVLSVCLRLSEQTKHLLAKNELKLLNEGALLINTARAEIIEKDALYAELSSGRIQAALDVFHVEPLPIDDPLRQMKNVLLSPHMGYLTQEVYELFFSQAVENLLNWKNGRPYRDAYLS